MKILPVVLLASVLLSGGLFACSEDKASSGGGPAAGASAGGTTSAGGSSGKGGAASGAAGDAGSTTAGGAAGAGGEGGVAGAGGVGSGGSSSGQAGCGGAAPMSTPECDKYEACVAGACSDISNKCFGPGYKQGSFGGTCKPFYDCAVACGCDNACKTTCGKNMAKDCQDCFTEFGTCSSTNCTADATACSKSVMP